MSAEQEFESYDWDNDDEWQVLIRRLEFPSNYTDEQKQRFLLKKKMRHFKKINPDFNGQMPPSSNSGSTSAPTASTEQKAQETPPRSSSNTSSSSASSSSSSRARSSGSSMLKKVAQYLNYFFLLANTLVALMGIVSIVIKPFFYRALILSGITHAMALFQNQGKPKMDAQYANALMTDTNLFCAMYSFLFYLAPANMIYIAPVVMRSGFMACHMGNNFLKARAPGLYPTVKPMLTKVLGMQGQLGMWLPMLEVYVGIMTAVNILLVGGSHLIITMVYWQILRSRYMLDSGIRSAFSRINRTIEGFLARFPTVLVYWQKVAKYAHESSDLYHLQQKAQAQQQAGGSNSWCNIQ